MKRIARWLAIVALVIAFAGATSGCNTVKGVGKDIQRGGEALEDAAE